MSTFDWDDGVKKYWEKLPPSIESVLEGNEKVNATDIDFSKSVL